MKHELGWWFPDSEQHLPDWMRRARQQRDGVLQYQFTKYLAALKHVRARRVAVDVGGHVGHWSRNMAADFDHVIAFEPVPLYAECWRRNLSNFANVRLEPVALGERAGTVSLRCGTHGSHGDTFVAPADAPDLIARDVPMRRLDEMGLADVDFLKIDCEGFELNVIKGGEQTIRGCKPCVIVEQKPGRAQKFGFGETDAVVLLEGWGAKRLAELSGDFICAWP